MRFLVFVLRRLAATALTLAAVSVLSFLLMDLAPGDFFDDMRLSPQMTPETAAALRARYGLDKGLCRALLGVVQVGAEGRVRRLDGL
jgi:peptide/nickel transport system permease protein